MTINNKYQAPSTQQQAPSTKHPATSTRHPAPSNNHPAPLPPKHKKTLSLPKNKHSVKPQTTTDIIGRACLDYLKTPDNSLKIEVWSNIVETDHIPVSHLFRNYEQMPVPEQSALRKCRGRVLDLGAGTGSHALHLQEQGMEVVAVKYRPVPAR